MALQSSSARTDLLAALERAVICGAYSLGAETASLAAQARQGRIAVLRFHGVPYTEHPRVNSTKEQCEKYMKHLAYNRFTVIAVRDLAKYVDPTVNPKDSIGVIQDRKKPLEAKRDRSNLPSGKN